MTLVPSFNSPSALQVAYYQLYAVMHQLGREQERKMLGYTRDHLGNVGLLAEYIGSLLRLDNSHVSKLAEKYQLSDELLELIFTCNGSYRLTQAGEGIFYLMGFLHDIGKPENPVWQKIYALERQLNLEEHQTQQGHAKQSSLIIVKRSGELKGNPTVPIVQMLSDAARFHHERLDGTGYEGKKGDQIPWCGLFTAVVDIFEAMTARRPYERDVHGNPSRKDPAEAIDEIGKLAFKHGCLDELTSETLIEAFRDPEKKKVLTGKFNREAQPS